MLQSRRIKITEEGSLIKIMGGEGNQLFNFILKTFKHTNNFVDVGGIFLWTASFSHLNLLTWQSMGTVSDAASPEFSEDGEQWKWQQNLLVGKSCLRFQSKLMKRDPNVKS